MKEHNLPVTSATENHLSVDQMYKYLDNHLAAADRHQVEMHLLDCDLCNDALSGLSLSDKEKTQRHVFEINYHLKNRTQRRQPNNIVQHLKNWGITTAILFMILLAALAVWYQAKQTPSAPNMNPTKTENINTDARPITGEAAFLKYIKTNLRYPQETRAIQVNGAVTISFLVNPDSTLSDFKVLNSTRPEMGKEAIRLLKEGPIWVPAQRNAKPIPERKTITIPFGLNK